MKARTTGKPSTLRIAAYTMDDPTRVKLRQLADRNDMSMSQVLRFLVKQSKLVLRDKKGEMIKGRTSKI